MPNNNVFAVGEKMELRRIQGIPFKPRGLKGRVHSVNNGSVGDIFAAGEKMELRRVQGIPFKPRGLKGRVRSVNNESVGDIVDDAHTYEDLCFLKQELEHYIGLMRKQGAREEHVKDLFYSIEKINKKLKKVIQLSLEQTL